MKNQHGFTLIELLIVVAIIAIIAAIAIPNLLTARMAANETGAIAGLRTIGSAQVAYSAINNGYYAADLDDLVDAENLDARFKNKFNGYGYEVGTPTTATSKFPISNTDQIDGFLAKPVNPGSTGRHTYSMGGDLVVRWEESSTGAAVPKCGSGDCDPGDPIGLNK